MREPYVAFIGKSILACLEKQQVLSAIATSLRRKVCCYYQLNWWEHAFVAAYAFITETMTKPNRTESYVDDELIINLFVDVYMLMMIITNGSSPCLFWLQFFYMIFNSVFVCSCCEPRKFPSYSKFEEVISPHNP